ncbi:hypothetical protein RR42_s1036 [Cupriavidus basilensis]|uniref:Uncharacterized protein n=1 Tax=Cupriavidus basilensis TaxID=68895 RepID=A0A0C4YJ19_9BURK|nr:hypothetical protein RR42_s1036 [Cupriavidus basilensis]
MILGHVKFLSAFEERGACAATDIEASSVESLYGASGALR